MKAKPGRLWPALAAGLLVGIAGVGLTLPREPAGSTQAAPPVNRVLDRRIDHYQEGEDGRRVARLEGTLEQAGDGVRYVLTASAFGNAIEPPPGYEGVPGANEITARELDRLLASGVVTARTREIVSGIVRPAPIEAGARESIPVRRVGRDGRLELDGRTYERYASGLRIESEILRPGHYELEVCVAGEVRLQSRFRVAHDAKKSRIETLAGMGGRHRTKRSAP